MTVGSRLETFRLFFIPITLSLLGVSFYRTYSSKRYIPQRQKVILWATAALSVGLTLYSILK